MWAAKFAAVLIIPLFYILALLIFPIFLLFFVPILIIREFVSLFSRIFGGSLLGKILSASATNHACLKGVGTSLVPFILKGTPNLEHIKNEFAIKVLNAKDSEGQLLYPELKQTVVAWGGYLFWKDVQNFQIPIRLLDLPEPVDLVSPDGLKLISSFYSKAWKLGEEPLWELILVPGLNESFGFVFIWDHALCDGLAVQKLIKNLDNPSYSTCVKPKVQSSETSKVLLHFLNLARFPYDVALFLKAILTTTIAESGLNRNDKVHHYIPNSRLMLDAITINLPDLKKIARAHGVSLNAVLMSSIQGSLQKVWKEKSLLYFPTPDPCHREKLRNVVGIGYVQLSGPCQKADERLQNIEDQLRLLKSSTFPMFANNAGRLTGSLPTFFIQKMINGATGNVKTFAFSTLIASRDPFHICGYPVIGMGSAGSANAGTLNVAFFAFSYEDLMSFTVMGDEGVVNKATGKALLQGVTEEIENLKEILDTKMPDHVIVTIQDVKRF